MGQLKTSQRKLLYPLFAMVFVTGHIYKYNKYLYIYVNLYVYVQLTFVCQKTQEKRSKAQKIHNIDYHQDNPTKQSKYIQTKRAGPSPSGNGSHSSFTLPSWHSRGFTLHLQWVPPTIYQKNNNNNKPLSQSEIIPNVQVPFQ